MGGVRRLGPAFAPELGHNYFDMAVNMIATYTYDSRATDAPLPVEIGETFFVVGRLFLFLCQPSRLTSFLSWFMVSPINVGR